MGDGAQLPETPHHVDEKMEHIVLSIKEFSPNQSLQIQVSREETTVVENGGDRGCWLRH